MPEAAAALGARVGVIWGRSRGEGIKNGKKFSLKIL